MRDKSTRQEDTWQKELLTVKEVAAYLRVSRVTIWRWCQQGTIPASQIGRNWRIDQADLSHLLENSRRSDLPSPHNSSSSPEPDSSTST
jgi:excisionase family DNA binding protein